MEPSSTPANGKETIGTLVDKLETAFKKGSTSTEAGQPSCVAGEHQSSELTLEQHRDLQAIPPPEEPEATMQLYDIPTITRPTIQVDNLDSSDRTPTMLTKWTFGLEQSSWPARNMRSVERVSRPIRMRVKYTCHHCKTTFGHDKECNSCRHRRCARCDRYPARKVRPNPDNQAPTSTSAAPAEEVPPQESEPTVTESFCTCHECQTVIEVEVQECPNCQHTICEKCHTEARLQIVDSPNGYLVTSTDEEERICPPDEQKLPPDSSATEEEPPAVSR